MHLGPAASTCWSRAPAMSASPRPCRSSRRGRSLAVAVVDAAPAGVWEKDGRASAIAAAACRMLDALGCWDEIAPQAQPITDMIVTDSRTVRSGAPGVPDLRRRGGARRALRAHGGQQGRSTARCAGARPNSASTSSRASRSARFETGPASDDGASRRRRSRWRRGCWSPPTA